MTKENEDKKIKTPLSQSAFERLVIKRLMQTCNACPAQWEGWIEDVRMIYVRFRWGYLSVNISNEPTENVYDAVGGKEIFGRQLSDNLDGCLDIDKLIKATVGVLEFPEDVL